MDQSLDKVLREHTDSLMAIPGVIGTAESLHEGAPCVMVLVARLTENLKRAIPDELEGYPVVISETGEIKAL